MKDKQSANCSLYSIDDLARSLVGSLPPRRQERLQQHLESCPHCRQRLHELTLVQAVLRQAPNVPLPRTFALSAQEVRMRRRTLWYPVLRTVTAATATLVLLLLLGGLLQPGLLGASPPARPVGAKATPLVAPTPRPVAVAPASTWRPRPTLPDAGPAIAAAPTVAPPDINSETAYPQPGESEPQLHGTVVRPAGPAAAPTAAQASALWPVLHLGGLILLGVLAGLTWLAYRRERAFFP